MMGKLIASSPCWVLIFDCGFCDDWWRHGWRDGFVAEPITGGCVGEEKEGEDGNDDCQNEMGSFDEILVSVHNDAH